MKTIFTITILFFLGVSQLAASSYNQIFYQLYIKGEMVEWVKVLNKAKTDYEKNPNQPLLEDIIRAQYGLIAFYLGDDEDELALQEIECADEYLKQLINEHPNEGWVYALEASFDGFRLILNPYRFFLKAPGVLSAVNKSNEMSPMHPDVMFLKANQTFYLPSFFGGNQEKGLLLYDKLASELLITPIKKQNNWFSLLYLTSYGIACTYANEYDLAIEVYRKIVKIEPEYDWVKNELLPQAIKKTENAYLKNRKDKVDR